MMVASTIEACWWLSICNKTHFTIYYNAMHGCGIC